MVEHKSRRTSIDFRDGDTGDAACPRSISVPLHPHHQAARATAGQIVHLSGHNQATVIDDRDRLAKILDLVELMAGEEYTATRAGLLGEHIADGVDTGWVKSGQRLVQDQHLRTVHQRGSELHSLLVPVGESIHLADGPVCDPQPFQPSCRGGLGVDRAHPVQSPEVLKLLADEHRRVQPPLLRHVPEAAPFRLADLDTIPPDHAGVQIGETEYSPHRCRLACPIGAQKAHHLSGWNGKGETVVGGERPVATSQSFELQESAHHLRLILAAASPGSCRVLPPSVPEQGLLPSTARR